MNEIEKAIEYWKEFSKEIEVFHNEYKGTSKEHIFDEQILPTELAISVLTEKLNGGWIPFKSEYDDYYKLDMLQGKLPDEGEEIIVTDGKTVWCDTFVRDGTECFLDSGNEFIREVVAWQSLPTPYKEEK